tara:strand:+ start:233 stop:1531 length:1299 start_codon:yes stop_codon:yes gene_type:complete
MLKIITCNKLNYKKKLFSYVNTTSINNQKRSEIVSNIIKKIKKNKDTALINYSNELDNNNFKSFKSLKVTPKEISNALSQCSQAFHDSIKLAMQRIMSYQKKLMPKNLYYKDKLGIKLGSIWSPLESCGLYVPGGKALYPSCVLMNAIPAKVAGVKRIVITTPANNNLLRPEILVAANAVGIREIYKIGGAQAIAALAFGTESIERVDKVVGPGNSFVTEAKKQLYGYVGIDSIAGPSEILVIADRYNNPKWVAMDLLSQAEHDEEARAILISDSKDFINKVNKYLLSFLKSINRTKIATKSIKKNGLAILIKDINLAHCIANYIAPEHLEIMTKNKKLLARKIKNAGAIFMGEYTPEAFGDYIAGPSHVLPTSGNARFDSGLSVLDFLKRTSYIEANKTGLKNTLHSIETLGNSEGLDAHVKSAKIRFFKD